MVFAFARKGLYSPVIHVTACGYGGGALAEITVEDLREYWRQLHAPKEGGLIRALSISEMPPWTSICEEFSWRLHRLNGGPLTSKRSGRPGIYRLIALQEEDLFRPAILQRLCGEDRTGTLYIGEATDLSARINQMRRSARVRPGGERSHRAITMLRQIRRLNHPRERLGVALMFTGRLTRAIERDLLHAYINSFGEMPPLNYKL